MNKKRIYNIVYVLTLFVIIIVLLIFQNLDDTLTLIIASTAIILTSIFTYSNRRKKWDSIQVKF
jgi:L-asparagine transporter-like permease